jgi:hypothetical protein
MICTSSFGTWALHEGDAESDAFYKRLDRNKPAHIDELRAYTTRVDCLRYEQELKTQIGLFGKAVVTSLERTMGHYLKVGSCNRAFSSPNPHPLHRPSPLAPRSPVDGLEMT